MARGRAIPATKIEWILIFFHNLPSEQCWLFFSNRAEQFFSRLKNNQERNQLSLNLMEDSFIIIIIYLFAQHYQG